MFFASRTRRVAASIAAGALVAAGGLAGCAQGSSTSSKAASGGEVSPITMWRAFNSDADQEYFVEHFIDPWNQDNPDAPIELTVRDWPNLERLQRTAMASGSGPDLVYTSGPAFALDYIQHDQLLPLTEYAEEYGWKDKIQGWAYEAGVVDDQLYILPATYEAMFMLYNPAVFAEKGWDVPENKEQLDKVLTEAAEAEMMPIAIGAGSWPATSEHLVSVAFANIAGPEATYLALEGEKSFTDQEFLEAITQLSDWFDTGAAGGGKDRFFTTTEPELYNKIVNGEGAIYPVGSWSFEHVGKYFGEAAGNDQDWQWAPFPALSDRVPEDTFALGLGETLSVNADTKNADKVAEYLNWLISNPKAQLQATADTGAAPMPLEFQDSDFPAEIDPRFKDFYLALAEAQDVGYTTWTFWPPKSHTYLVEEMDKVITGQLTPEEYLKGLDEVFAQEQAEGLVPPRPIPSSLEK